MYLKNTGNVYSCMHKGCVFVLDGMHMVYCQSHYLIWEEILVYTTSKNTMIDWHVGQHTDSYMCWTICLHTHFGIGNWNIANCIYILYMYQCLPIGLFIYLAFLTLFHNSLPLSPPLPWSFQLYFTIRLRDRGWL